MTILNVFLLVTVVGLLLLPATNAAMMYDKNADFELKKPLVVPAAEADYHYTMIEVDTLASGSKPLYGLIGVILLDGVFTFSGIEETYLLNLKQEGGKRCMPFKGINVVHKCNHEYFALNADFINIQKTVLNKNEKLSTVCINRSKSLPRKFNPDNDKGLKGNQQSSNLVIRFGSRVLMAYKPGANYNKCIGTYDEEDDYFTCMMPTKDGKLEGFSMGSFMFNNLNAQVHRDDNTVEVFCKLPHVYTRQA